MCWDAPSASVCFDAGCSSSGMARVTEVPRTPPGEEMAIARRASVACAVHASMSIGWTEGALV